MPKLRPIKVLSKIICYYSNLISSFSLLWIVVNTKWKSLLEQRSLKEYFACKQCGSLINSAKFSPIKGSSKRPIFLERAE
jgi:hypothetical protein